jgi:UDP-glucose 4-epimerase
MKGETPLATYLVTGGCGFIGSHLAAALVARGNDVRVLDDLSTGSVANLAPAATLIRGDVADPATVRRAMEGVDGCFHLAAIASVERGVREWLLTHRVNLSGTIAVLDAATQKRVPVVYASSAAVYGDASAIPLDEECYPRPLSAYGADKLGCEQHARAAGQVHSVPSVGLRFFNVFGPRQDPRSPYSGVISIFCDRLSRGEPVDVFGDGGQTRDFVYVADVVAALLASMDQASTAAPVYNVCTGEPTSVLALAETVASLCGTALRVQPRPPRSGEIRHSVGSPLRARAALKLPAPWLLRDGLAETIAWQRSGRAGLAA